MIRSTGPTSTCCRRAGATRSSRSPDSCWQAGERTGDPVPIPTEPEGFPYHQWYRLERRRMQCAAEIAASQPDRRAWVIVTPLTPGGFHVRYYEIERDRYEEACETWDWDLLGIVLDEVRV